MRCARARVAARARGTRMVTCAAETKATALFSRPPSPWWEGSETPDAPIEHHVRARRRLGVGAENAARVVGHTTWRKASTRAAAERHGARAPSRQRPPEVRAPDTIHSHATHSTASPAELEAPPRRVAHRFGPRDVLTACRRARTPSPPSNHVPARVQRPVGSPRASRTAFAAASSASTMSAPSTFRGASVPSAR